MGLVRKWNRERVGHLDESHSPQSENQAEGKFRWSWAESMTFRKERKESLDDQNCKRTYISAHLFQAHDS